MTPFADLAPRLSSRLLLLLGTNGAFGAGAGTPRRCKRAGELPTARARVLPPVAERASNASARSLRFSLALPRSRLDLSTRHSTLGQLQNPYVVSYTPVFSSRPPPRLFHPCAPSGDLFPTGSRTGLSSIHPTISLTTQGAAFAYSLDARRISSSALRQWTRRLPRRTQRRKVADYRS